MIFWIEALIDQFIFHLFGFLWLLVAIWLCCCEFRGFYCIGLLHRSLCYVAPQQNIIYRILKEENIVSDINLWKKSYADIKPFNRLQTKTNLLCIIFSFQNIFKKLSSFSAILKDLWERCVEWSRVVRKPKTRKSAIFCQNISSFFHYDIFTNLWSGIIEIVLQYYWLECSFSSQICVQNGFKVEEGGQFEGKLKVKILGGGKF